MIANSLFHFTRKLETVTNILTSQSFRASYNIEDVSDFFPNERYVGIPMICFCDIPLKFISEHARRYGMYGIGLTKEWGILKKVNPILYRTSPQVNEFFTAAISATNFSTTDSNALYSQAVIKDKILRLSNYSKSYELDGTSNYVDREWRYVPASAEIPFLKSKAKSVRKDINRKYFSHLPDYLPFGWDDLKYIIVPEKKDVDKLLRKMNALTINNLEKLRLSQLIIASSSIAKDF